MFGKPEWFRAKKFGYGLTPVCWQGWRYTFVWAAIIVLPVFILALRGQGVELVIWMVASIAMLCWDANEIYKQLPQKSKRLDCGKIWNKYCPRRFRRKAEEHEQV